jgi:hypothetical protein
MPIYDAALLANGELLMKGTTDPDSNADQSLALITAYGTTTAEAVDAVGILQDVRYNPNYTQAIAGAGHIPDHVPATNANGPLYGKVIINPFAVYLAEYDQADAIAISSTSTTTLTVGSLADDIDGTFVYFVGTHTGVTGSLRHLEASAAGSATMDSALVTTGVASDTIIRTLPPLAGGYAGPLTKLNTTATGLTTTAAVGTTVTLRVVDNYVQADNLPFCPLRKASHKGKNNLQKAKLFADIVLADHLFNPLA